MSEVKMTYSISGNDNPKCVATVEYGLRKSGDDGVMLLGIEGVRFLEGASERFMKTVLTHVGTSMWYRRGMTMEQQWPGWEKNGFRVKDITECDVSFDKFWQVYGFKVGNKAGVAKKWEKLSWEEKVLAIGCVPRLRRWYEQKGIQMPYPETYINQRRWENEFEG